MSYRPQFALNPSQAGCLLESFIYVYDLSNTPALNGLALASGQEILHIPLHLDDDADFIWLGTKIDPTSLGVKLETAWTEPLMNDYVPAKLYADTVAITPIEAGVECPSGSVISLSLKNLS